MDPLTPIPTPAAQRWREFRIQVLPIVVFICALSAVVLMWKNYVTPASLIGEVEAVRANVTIVEPGTLAELTVDLYQPVTKGQPIGVVRGFDPDNTKAQIAAIQADLKVMESRMHLDVQRNHLSYEQFRMDIVDQRVQLAVARANLQGAMRECDRNKKLAAEEKPLVSQTEVDEKCTLAEAYQSEVEERSALVAEMEKKLTEILSSDRAPEGTNNPIIAAIRTQEEALFAAEKPTIIKAPIDGVISAINFRPGEKVLAGQPIVVVSSPQAERILGYVRAPITQPPEVGMDVEIRPRTHKRQFAVGQVLSVGVQMESISTARYSVGMSSNVFEQALPIVVSLPSELRLLPGQIVDLNLKGISPSATPKLVQK